MQPLIQNIKVEPGLEDIVKVEVDLTPLLEVPPIDIKKELISPKKEKDSSDCIEISEPTKFIGAVKHEPRRKRKRYPNFYRKRRTYGWDPQPSHKNSKLNEWRRTCLFKIGIWDKCFMCDNKLKKLKRAIINNLLKCDGPAPSFYECTEQTGWLQISLKSQKGVDWVCSNVPQMKPWPGASFVLRYCNDVRNRWKVTFTVSKSDVTTGQEVVTLLKKQNAGLNVHEWGMDCVRYVGDSISVDFQLNEEQIDELRTVDYSPTVGFTKAAVKLTPNRIYSTSELITTLEYNRNYNSYYRPY